jgi:eukaryotic-like serine/threonine-protein kinase
VGSVLWETLVGERLFDGKSDVEIFKKIRACQVQPVIERRPDVPVSLSAVLETALSADPANRYATADEFAHALGQVMKQAVGVNAAQGLATAVAEARAKLKSDAVDTATTTERATPPGSASQDVVFSKAEIGVEPVELTQRKSGPVQSQVGTEPALKRPGTPPPTPLPKKP